MEQVPVNVTARTEWLFYHLWKKSPETGRSCESILIPSTVFFRWAHPHVWYKMSNEFKIVRMKNEKINIDDIYDNFNHNIGESEVVNTYTYKDVE
jgi:hypothetical protein